jgi:glycosyltransferase involved in cell wall biosynthesis
MSSLFQKKISFIIPAFNEEQDIESTLSGQLKECIGLDIELIVVDDGSEDNTKDITSKFFAKFPSGFLLSSGHNGRGGALSQGIMAATGDILILSAADIVLKRKIIEEIVDFNSNFDLILLSKNLPNSIVLGRNYTRTILSRVFNIMVRMMFNLKFKDTQGIKIGNREHLVNIIKYCNTKGFIFDLEMIVYASKLKYTMIELPWELIFRAGSKTVIKNIHKILFELFELRYKTTFVQSPINNKKDGDIHIKQIIKENNQIN